MKVPILLLAFLLGVSGNGQSPAPRASASSSNPSAEQVQLNVPLERVESEMQRVEQLVNHLGGTILSRSKTTGKSEVLARVPADNVQYFRENVRGPSARSSSVPASADQIFDVIVVAP